jgi:hypothetical protein
MQTISAHRYIKWESVRSAFPSMPLVVAASALALLAALTPMRDAMAQTANVCAVENPFATIGQIALQKQENARLEIVKGLGFRDGKACFAPPAVSPAFVDVHRSLIVHDEPTLTAANFSLRRTLSKIASDVAGTAPGTTAETIFTQFWDTQNDFANAVLADNFHCSDNSGALNGFPWQRCKRPEGEEAKAPVAPRLDTDYTPISITNRLDLAGAGWRNCGEHRITYVKKQSTRSPILGSGINYVIFEAVLPNPTPGCRSGCRPVVDFWLDLSTDSSPTSRAAKLEQFLYVGLPGFRPVVHQSHYASGGVATGYGSSGSGQIRTNQFLFGTDSLLGAAVFTPPPWTLKEFKTLLSCAGGKCEFDFVPIPVKMSPFGPLFNADVAAGTPPTLDTANPYATSVADAAAKAMQFQSEFVAQISADKLAAPTLTGINYAVSHAHLGASSEVGSIYSRYHGIAETAMSPSFRNAIDAAVAAFPGLTREQVLKRATAMSCAGCHMPSDMGLMFPNSIAPGVVWPHSGHFAHVQSTVTDDAGSPPPGFDPVHFGGSARNWHISPALQDVFLPERRSHLVSVANEPVCDCVPVKNIASIDGALTAIQQDVINAFAAKLFAELNLFRFSGKPDDKLLWIAQQKLLAAANQLIADMTGQRNLELEKAGMRFDVPSLVPRATVLPLLLPATSVYGKERSQLKMQVVHGEVASEPPRQTVTGSLRVH